MLFLRVSTAIILMFSMLFLPWWVSAIFVLIPLFYFKWYVEGIVIAFLYDVIFAVPVSYLYGFEYVATTSIFFVLIFFTFIKKRLFWTQEL